MAEPKTKTISTRLELAYVDVLEIMAAHEGMNISEFLRTLIIPIIEEQFEDPIDQFQGEPSEFFLAQAQEWLKIGLAKLRAEKGD